MTDLEMTRLCAEAMGFEPYADQPPYNYDPLYDDAQAMALVKKFGVALYQGETGCWYADLPGFAMRVRSLDLNRAIVECVAKMQESKH